MDKDKLHKFNSLIADYTYYTAVSAVKKCFEQDGAVESAKALEIKRELTSLVEESLQ